MHVDHQYELYDLTIGWAALGLLVGLLPLIAMLLQAWREGRALPMRGQLKTTHWLPVILQGSILLYWSVYFSPVRLMVTLIPFQVAFAFVTDIWLSWYRYGKWRVTVGPVPIVLSMNLFVWFTGPAFLLSYGIIFLALLSKQALRVGERHIFNPSAFGIAVVSVFCVLLPESFPYIDLASSLNVAPNMVEVIFLLSLVPFVRLGLAWVPIGALAVSFGQMRGFDFGAGAVASALGLPEPQIALVWAPIFLSITLFAADPGTVPKSALGRFLFGIGVGWCLLFMNAVLTGLFNADYFGKVFGVVLANMLFALVTLVGARLSLAGTGERLAATWKPLAARLPSPKMVGVLCYSVMVLWTLVATPSKPHLFLGTAEAHYHNRTPFLAREEGSIADAANPLFTQGFSFHWEIAHWWGHFTAD